MLFQKSFVKPNNTFTKISWNQKLLLIPSIFFSAKIPWNQKLLLIFSIFLFCKNSWNQRKEWLVRIVGWPLISLQNFRETKERIEFFSICFSYIKNFRRTNNTLNFLDYNLISRNILKKSKILTFYILLLNSRIFRETSVCNQAEDALNL